MKEWKEKREWKEKERMEKKGRCMHGGFQANLPLMNPLSCIGVSGRSATNEPTKQGQGQEKTSLRFRGDLQLMNP